MDLITPTRAGAFIDIGAVLANDEENGDEDVNGADDKDEIEAEEAEADDEPWNIIEGNSEEDESDDELELEVDEQESADVEATNDGVDVNANRSDVDALVVLTLRLEEKVGTGIEATADVKERPHDDGEKANDDEDKLDSE
jgi:hypothetical protein